MLLKAMLVSSFGRGSPRPLRAALLRLSGLGGGALALGLLFAAGVRSLEPAVVLDDEPLFFSCLLAVQLVVVVTLLSGRAAQALPGDAMGRWLHSLPLGVYKRAGLLMLPALLLTGLSLLLALPPLGALTAQFGLPWALLIAGVLLGSASAFGLVYGVPWRLLVVPAVVWVEYKYRIAWLQSTLVIVLSGLGAHRLWRDVRQVPKQAVGRSVRTAWLPPPFWMVKKVMRSKSIVPAFAANFGLAIGLAVFSHRQGVADPAGLGLFGALLAGSFCSDMRALARRCRPAEITALRGTLHFAAAELVTAIFSGAIIALPLALSLQAVPAEFVTQIILGSSFGLLAGTLLVPEARDVLSQSLAVLLILTLLAGLPQLNLFTWGPAMYAIAAILATAIAVWIELKRNNYIWRDLHAK